MSAITDAIVTAGQVLGAVLPSVVESLTGGTPSSILTHALIVTAEDVALRRVGAHVHPLVALAVRLEDIAGLLLIEHQPIIASAVQLEAAELRKRATVLGGV